MWDTDTRAHAAFIMIPHVYVDAACAYEPAACWLSPASFCRRMQLPAARCHSGSFLRKLRSGALSRAKRLALQRHLASPACWPSFASCDCWCWCGPGGRKSSLNTQPAAKRIILLLNYRLVLLVDCGVLSQGLRGDDHTPSHIRNHTLKNNRDRADYFSPSNPNNKAQQWFAYINFFLLSMLVHLLRISHYFLLHNLAGVALMCHKLAVNSTRLICTQTAS